jgi:hypothetical protein
VTTPTTVPRNSDELAEMLADPAKRKEIFASADSTQEFMDAYAKAQQGDGTDLNRQIAEETQRQFAAMLRDNGFDAKDKDAAKAIKRLNLDPQARRGGANMLTSHRQGTAHNAAAPGAALDQYFADGIEYVRNIWHKNTSPEARRPPQRRVVGVAGGWRVPRPGDAAREPDGAGAGGVGRPAARHGRPDGVGEGSVPDDRLDVELGLRVRRHDRVLG